MSRVVGRVTNKILNMITNVAYADGCQRPGPIEWEVGSTVISEAEMVYGLCEHEVLSVIPPKPVAVPQVKRTSPQAKPATTVKAEDPPLTVESILAAVERKKAKPRAVLPKEDEPVDEATIARAAIPPKLRSDYSTAPANVKKVLAIPMELRFEESLENYSEDEIRELGSGPSSIDVPIGKPTSPFAEGYDPRGTSGPKTTTARRPGKPVSVFDR